MGVGGCVGGCVMIVPAIALEYLSAYIQFRLRSQGLYVDVQEADYLAHQWNGTALAQVDRYLQALQAMVYERGLPRGGLRLTYETLRTWVEQD